MANDIRLTPVPADELPTKAAWKRRANRHNVVVIKERGDTWSFREGNTWETHSSHAQLEDDGTLFIKAGSAPLIQVDIRYRLMERL